MDHVIESQDAGLIESILIPFDLYNDSAQHALTSLKQRFLYDEIEAEVGSYLVSLDYQFASILGMFSILTVFFVIVAFLLNIFNQIK